MNFLNVWKGMIIDSFHYRADLLRMKDVCGCICYVSKLATVWQHAKGHVGINHEFAVITQVYDSARPLRKV